MKRLAIEAVIVLALLAGAFVSGRCSKSCPPAPAPAAVASQTESVTKAMDRLERAVADTRSTLDQGPERIVYRPVRLPGPGCPVAQEIEVERGPSRATTERRAESSSAARTESVRTVEVVRPLELRPTWSVAALLGWDRGRALYGGAVSRRVLGPFEAGAWVLAPGIARPAVGVSLGIHW